MRNMHHLDQRNKKIHEKRMETPWKQFLKETASRRPLTFYKNSGVTSKYPESDRVQRVVPNSSWMPDSIYALEIDEASSFFNQFAELLKRVDLSATIIFGGSENATYSDQTVTSSGVYLSSIVIQECKNVLYSFEVKQFCDTVVNSLSISNHSEHVFSSVSVDQGYRIFYSRNIYNSSDIWFSSNLIGCTECLFCNKLENKSYCIQNKQLAKDEYFKKKQQILSQKHMFDNWFIHVFTQSIENYQSANCTGSYLFACEGIQDGLLCKRLQNGHNVCFGASSDVTSDVYDCFAIGTYGARDFYGVMGAGGGENVYCSVNVPFCSQVYYSYNLESCSYCLGCVGLRNKSYYIFNKKYDKEEWYNEVDKIFAHMEQEGTLGQFFPGWINPFYFNDTAASLIEDFEKEEIVAEGYLRRDEPIQVDVPSTVDVVPSTSLGLYEKTEGKEWIIDQDILKKVIQDENGNYYRIIPIEYKFLKKHGLPLPRLHWLERLRMQFNVS